MPNVAVEHLVVGDVVQFADDLGRTWTRGVFASTPRNDAFMGSNNEFWFLGLEREIPTTFAEEDVICDAGGGPSSPRSSMRYMRYLEVRRGTLMDVVTLADRQHADA